MAITVTIEGTPIGVRTEDGISVDTVANQAGTFTFKMQLEGARPSLGDEVVLYEDAVAKFGGNISRIDEWSTAQDDLQAISTLEITVGGFNALANRQYVREVIPIGNLKAALTIVVAELAQYGVTLHGSQVDGPTLPALDYTGFKLAMDVLGELMGLTADAGEPYVWEIDENKVLRAWQPSTNAAPFNYIVDRPEIASDLRKEIAREEDYATKVILRMAAVDVTFNRPDGAAPISFVGDGSTTVYNIEAGWTVNRTYVIIHTPTIGGGETLGLPGDTPVMWTYDPAARTLTRVAGPTTLGVTYEFHFDGTFEATGEATTGAAPADEVERLIEVDSVPDEVSAQAYAESVLAQLSQDTETLHFDELRKGIRVGQSFTIINTFRNVNTTAVITEISAVGFGSPIQFRSSITAVIDTSQTNLGRGFRDTYRQWFGDKAGSAAAAAVIPTAPPSGGPGGPIYAVQYNSGAGTFGGQVELTWDPVTHCLVAGGGGSSITATEKESCFVFGYNCHITDP